MTIALRCQFMIREVKKVSEKRPDVALAFLQQLMGAADARPHPMVKSEMTLKRAQEVKVDTKVAVPWASSLMGSTQMPWKIQKVRWGAFETMAAPFGQQCLSILRPVPSDECAQMLRIFSSRAFCLVNVWL